MRDATTAETEDYAADVTAAEEYNHSIQAKLNQITSRDESTDVTVTTSTGTELVKRAKKISDELPIAPRSTIPLGALLLLLLSLVANFKSQSTAIGYCDSGDSTNNIILSKQSAMNEAKACIARRTALDIENPGAGKEVQCDVSELPLVPFIPLPTACAPCPPHAVCEQGEIVSCQPEYILSTHPLSFFAPALDGLPGLGPRAFPPSCKPDTVKKRMIGGLAQSIENDLAQTRGLITCSGKTREGKKSDGELYGVEEHAMKEHYAIRRDVSFSLPSPLFPLPPNPSNLFIEEILNPAQIHSRAIRRDLRSGPQGSCRA